MFINSSHLKKLMTAAYKGSGIRIGYMDDGYTILGGTWGLWLEVNYIPNKVKAIIMELAGTLPDEDTVFKVSKENPIPQLEMDFQDYFHINMLHKEARLPVTVTNVLIDKYYSLYNLLQVKETKRIIMMKTHLMDLINLDEIDPEQENTPVGPCTGFSQSMFFWRNATCTLLLLGESVPSDNPVINALSVIDFEKEVNK